MSSDSDIIMRDDLAKTKTQPRLKGQIPRTRRTIAKAHGHPVKLHETR